jgi:glycosyltransferase involved in cell wall biosynthesis
MGRAHDPRKGFDFLIGQLGRPFTKKSGLNPMNKTICLDDRYSTTRRVRRVKPELILAETKAGEKPEDQFEAVLFLPEGAGRQGDGGFRTKGYFKQSETDKPLITVVTVVFNGEAHLEETILSVLDLTYDNVEYIVIDGASTDGTVDVIRRYEHAIDYWVSEKDGGIYDAMNKGIRCVTGQAILFMNSGDCIINHGFQCLIRYFGIVICEKKEATVIYGNNIWRGSLKPGANWLPNYLPLLGRLPSHQVMLIPIELQRRSPYLAEFPVSADQDFKIHLVKLGIVYRHISENICISSVGGVSQHIKNHANLIERSKETYRIFRKHYGYLWGVIYSLLFYMWNLRKILICSRQIHE